MIIKNLRTEKTCRQHGNETSFIHGVNGVELRMIPCGHFVVTKNNISIIYPAVHCLVEVEADAKVEAKPKKDESR